VVESVPHDPQYHVFEFFCSGGAGPAFDARQLIAQRLRQRYDRQPVLALCKQHAVQLWHGIESVRKQQLWYGSFQSVFHQSGRFDRYNRHVPWQL
jgi:hypothetical protein